MEKLCTDAWTGCTGIIQKIWRKIIDFNWYSGPMYFPFKVDMKLAPTDETSEMESAQNFMKNDSIFAGELNRGVISSREKKPTTS